MTRIKVFARVRPSKRPSGFFEFQDDHNQLKFDVPLRAESGLVNNSKSEYIFKFDGLLPMGVSQEVVFKKVARDAVLSAIDGFNSTLFAYGQTGSGKTFTITGGAERYNDRGIIPRALSFMFNEFKKRPDTQFTAYISYLEIYNEQGYDLLDPSHETKSLEELPRVTIMEDEDGNTFLKNLSMHPASSEEEALNLLFLGDTNRAISETPMNDASSRSHCVFTISIEARTAGSSTIRRSKFHLVDLAGSERVHKTSSSGQTLREAKHINVSLHFLEMVIINLSGKKKNAYVPYRNCRITQVLRDSLGGNCKTAMIATINPEAEFTDESISTCRFAQRVAQVKNSAIVNEETDPYLLIKQLKAEVSSLKAEIAFLKGEQDEGDELDDESRAELMRLCREWVMAGRGPKGSEGAALRLGDFTLNRIHGAFHALKTLAMEGGGPGAGSGAGQGAGDFAPIASSPSKADAADGAELKRLRAQLHNRDQEIAILVKMVKKEKDKNARLQGHAPAASSSSSSSAPPPISTALPPRGAGGSAAMSPIRGGGTGSGSGGGALGERGWGAAAGAGGGRGSSPGSRRDTRTPSSAVGVGSTGRKVGGGAGGMIASLSVPPDVLVDRKRSLEMFKQHYPKQRVVEDNLAVMKTKIKEVKALAGSVNQARQRIQYLKATIEQVRVEDAVHGIVDGGESKAGPSPKEAKLFAEMAEEKKVYRSGYQKLQKLRKEVTHIDRLINKCRKQLNSDFESWYTASLANAGLTHTSVAAISGVMQSAQARATHGKTGGAGARAGGGAGAPHDRHARGGAAVPASRMDAGAGAGAGAGQAPRGGPGQAWRGTSADGRSHGGEPRTPSRGNLYDRAQEMRAKQQQQQQQRAPAGGARAHSASSGIGAATAHHSRGMAAPHARAQPHGAAATHAPSLSNTYSYRQQQQPQQAYGARAPGGRSSSAGSSHYGHPPSGQPVASATLPAGGYSGYRGAPAAYGAPQRSFPVAAMPQQGGPRAAPAPVAASHASARHAHPSAAAAHASSRHVYPASPSTGIRSSGATLATSGARHTGATENDIQSFYKAKAMLEQMRTSFRK